MRNFLLSARQFFSFNFDLIAVIVMLFWVSYSGSMTHWNSTSGSDLDHFLNLHFILHQPAKFRPIRRRHCGNVDLYFTINMTSYRFIKMAAADAECYFRFSICWYRCLQKFKVYDQTKFRRHISIDGWDLTTSVFQKKNKRPPYWNSTFGFDLDHFP